MRRTDIDPMFEEAEGLIGPELTELISRCWDAWDGASDAGVGVDDSMPILYFGDLIAYQSSLLRVVTVGLNPSGEEFPSSNRYARFPGASGVRRYPVRYFEVLNEYFGTNPYRWFDDYEQVLCGIGVSYTPSSESTALHTDICSPAATSPTWSRLDGATKDRLLEDGVPLWHDLIRFLRPQIVVMSVAHEHLARIGFPLGSDWEVLHKITHKSDGTERRQHFPAMARWHDIDGHSALLVYGKAAQTPFGTVTHHDKHIIGETAKTYYELTQSSLATD